MKSLRNVRVLVVLAGLAGLAGLSGCNGIYSYNPNGMTYALSGTITLTNLNATGYAMVTATVGSYRYMTSVLVPAAVAGVQTVTYSVPGLPAGTYSVTLAIDSPNSTLSSYTYQVNGGAAVSDPPARSGSGPYTWTMTVSGLPVNANVQLDAAMI